jgi:vancomycin resistance protein VanW
VESAARPGRTIFVEPGTPKSATAARAYRARLAVCTVRRLTLWMLSPSRWPKPETSLPERSSGALAFPHLAYDERIGIRRTDSGADPLLEQGKRVNLALAAPSFDGVVVRADRPLSFWRTLGKVTAARGFQYGMELRAGCIVPALGGGICLLSNALFEMAGRLGWTVLERHGHSLDAGIPPRSLWGLDATVLWPHVDLCIAPQRGSARLHVRVANDELHIAVEAEARPEPVELREEAAHEGAGVRANVIVRRMGLYDEVLAVNRKRVLAAPAQRRNCLVCNETSCRDRVVLRGAATEVASRTGRAT